MQMTAWHLMDILLALLLLGLACGALSTRDLKRGVVLFIAFGLLLSLVWARLRAPDLALAEAAIGAGLSGALLLSALRDAPAMEESGEKSIIPKLGVGLLSLGLAGVLAWAWFVAISAGAGERLAGIVMVRLEESGVGNPVTAVLLNFRAYDTLLEVGRADEWPDVLAWLGRISAAGFLVATLVGAAPDEIVRSRGAQLHDGITFHLNRLAHIGPHQF